MGASTYDSSKRRRLGETRRQSLQTCSLRECKISCVPPYENRPEKKSCTIPAKLTAFVEAPTHVTFRGVRQLQSRKPVPHSHTNVRCWHRHGEAGRRSGRSIEFKAGISIVPDPDQTGPSQRIEDEDTGPRHRTARKGGVWARRGGKVCSPHRLESAKYRRSRPMKIDRKKKKSCPVPTKLTRFLEAPTHVTFRGQF